MAKRETKSDKEKKQYARMAVLQSLISPWKMKGEKREKIKLLQHGVFEFGHRYPSTNPAEHGLTLLSGRNMFLVVL